MGGTFFVVNMLLRARLLPPPLLKKQNSASHIKTGDAVFDLIVNCQLSIVNYLDFVD